MPFVSLGSKVTARIAGCVFGIVFRRRRIFRIQPTQTLEGRIIRLQSAGCLGQKEVVTAAHNACIRELLQEIDVHGKADRHMKLLTVETESRLGTLWDQEPRGRKRMRSHQYQRSSIKKDSGGEDWTELDWTR
jgi:hypothetical protein